MLSLRLPGACIVAAHFPIQLKYVATLRQGRVRLQNVFMAFSLTNVIPLLNLSHIVNKNYTGVKAVTVCHWRIFILIIWQKIVLHLIHENYTIWMLYRFLENILGGDSVTAH